MSSFGGLTDAERLRMREQIASLKAAEMVRCDGSRDCEARLHVHGCFADDGRCDDPQKHGGEA